MKRAEGVRRAVSEQRDTLEDVYEPYLIKAGFLIRTPRGRVVTPLAYKHLGRTPPKTLPTGQQSDLFE